MTHFANMAMWDWVAFLVTPPHSRMAKFMREVVEGMIDVEHDHTGPSRIITSRRVMLLPYSLRFQVST
jgi:hypothetical protein